MFTIFLMSVVLQKLRRDALRLSQVSPRRFIFKLMGMILNVFLMRTNRFWSELFWILIMYCVKVCAIRYFIKTVSLSIEGKDTESCNDAWWRRQMEFDGEFEIEIMFYRGVEC
mmetsp:Transcript_21281/g.32577  ORF Transcript_21281/g.32577 Transcript_21281/m.32577 type:complete len:113 (-) Transcript_21281:71-409(-)